ncbi:DUF4255 domain-containing protein [Actinomadura sp. DC4]|uniref:DUF4255 domain-containing protein n=1 Tax=Actinomadura sp. DC4 TaxID=3055069 RepID=UPI0025AEDC3F|nr:DUF4255 domain-containing protein [Actinomadura sp. DC4]MDN3354876.1 DUF4255 domain-containing protein [Actinomadura sp. DC4]
MIDDLDASLLRLLGDARAPEAVRDADVSFETPARTYAPSRPTLNLFLHQVTENQTLREAAPFADRSGPSVLSRRPPLRVDCGYLVTAWSDLAAGSAVRVAQEHRLLGAALAWLSGFSAIPAAYLQGACATQEFPPPVVVARPHAPGEEPGQFWTALQIPPRPALGLLVTLSLDVAPAADLGPPVAGIDVRLPGDPPPVRKKRAKS